MKLRPFFSWRQFWIGVHWFEHARRLLVMPIPFVGLRLDFESPPEPPPAPLPSFDEWHAEYQETISGCTVAQKRWVPDEVWALLPAPDHDGDYPSDTRCMRYNSTAELVVAVKVAFTEAHRRRSAAAIATYAALPRDMARWKHPCDECNLILRLPCYDVWECGDGRISFRQGEGGDMCVNVARAAVLETAKILTGEIVTYD